jgi:Holliday junction resolvase-like predicted endonuclease
MNKAVPAMRSAKVYLEMRGYEIIELNWRRSKNRIDIIARKSSEIYFVEVVYEGLDNRDSLQVNASWVLKLRSAGESWVEENKWSGAAHYASILIDTGNDYSIMSFTIDIV